MASSITLPQTFPTLVPVPPSGSDVLYLDGSYVAANAQSPWQATGLLAKQSSAGVIVPVAYDNPNVASTAASSAINTAETYITPAFSMPAGVMTAGSTYRISIDGTCTSSAANLSTFTLRCGTAGTTSDSSMGTLTCTAATSGTAVGFTLVFYLTIQGTGATAATVMSGLMINQASGATAATGINSSICQVAVGNNVGTVDTTSANFIGVSYKSAANTTTSTFQNCTVECVRF